jgi:hypothetical protein
MSYPVVYTCVGNVEGSCGKRHLSLATAHRCLARYKKLCAKVDCENDRFIQHWNGAGLSVAELEELDSIAKERP